MKQAKDRVIAIDYFRGLFIIMVVVNHAMLFSLPFAYLTGAGRMWTSAAELLLLISGLTFGIVRGHQIKSDFLTVYKKTLRRAGQIYLVNVLVVALSLLLAVYAVSHNLVNYVYGTMPSTSGLHLLRSILSFSYSIGSAGFLGVFAILLLAAPPLLYVLSTRLWPSVPILSAAIFLFTTHGAGSSIPYSWLGQWQIYFILGLLMAKFRVGLLS
jgi:hypothetical protein